MGLLDDAIREHLEFKRLHGADPGEVARQEHEALGPVDRGENAASVEPASSAAEAEPRAKPASSAEVLHPAIEQPPSQGGEETAELDMRTVLKTEQPVRAAAPPAEESLEWEVPGGPESESPTAASAEAEDREEPVEDVLEETPDFLHETPDQDRLWFEQQPPRDFDFDK